MQIIHINRSLRVKVSSVTTLSYDENVLYSPRHRNISGLKHCYSLIANNCFRCRYLVFVSCLMNCRWLRAHKIIHTSVHPHMLIPPKKEKKPGVYHRGAVNAFIIMSRLFVSLLFKLFILIIIVAMSSLHFKSPVTSESQYKYIAIHNGLCA